MATAKVALPGDGQQISRAGGRRQPSKSDGTVAASVARTADLVHAASGAGASSAAAAQSVAAEVGAPELESITPERLGENLALVEINPPAVEGQNLKPRTTITFHDQAARTESKYTVVKYIASGHFAAVYKVRGEDGQFCALKIMDKKSPEFDRNQVLTEIVMQIRAQAASPETIVVINDAGENTRHMVLRMDFVDGADLLTYIERAKEQRLLGNGFTPKQKAALHQSLVETMQKLHAAGVVHLDLKPENIMYDPKTRRIYIVDFWCSAKLKTTADPREMGCQNFDIGEIAGTLRTLDPVVRESVVSGRPGDIVGVTRKSAMAVDLYGLGAVLLYLYLGRDGEALISAEEQAAFFSTKLDLKESEVLPLCKKLFDGKIDQDSFSQALMKLVLEKHKASPLFMQQARTQLAPVITKARLKFEADEGSRTTPSGSKPDAELIKANVEARLQAQIATWLDQDPGLRAKAESEVSAAWTQWEVQRDCWCAEGNQEFAYKYLPKGPARDLILRLLDPDQAKRRI